MPRFLYIFFLLVLIIQSCANQTSPTGGPKDEEPPKLIAAVPENGTINFRGTRITLTFNEDIQLKSPKTQILITPRVDIPYDIKARRETVILEFDSLLDENTTYTISFRESIQDLTEGNPAQQLQIAFSTGSQLDSLKVTGNVYDLQSGIIPEKSTVVLYREQDTTDIFTDLPYYFTETIDSGKFIISNVKAGNYRIYAFNDYNNNLKAESNKEPYAFLTDIISLDSNIYRIAMPLVSLDLSEIRMLSSRPSGTTYNIKYNKPVTDYQITTSDSLLYLQDINDPSILEVFNVNNYTENDSILTIVTVSDSLNQIRTDTLFAKFNTESRRSEEFSLRTSLKPVLISNPAVSGTIDFNKPATLLKSDSLFLFIDSLNIVPIDSMTYSWDKQLTSFSFSYPLRRDLFSTDQPQTVDAAKTSSRIRPYLRIGNSAFISVENDSSRGLSLQLDFQRESDLSRLIINIQTDNANIILQLLTDDHEIVREIISPQTKTVYFNNLSPGTYKLRAITDLNANGSWDPGNYKMLIEPEPIQYFIPKDGNSEMQLRANFEREETFIIR